MATAACLSRRSKNQVNAARERLGRNACSTDTQCVADQVTVSCKQTAIVLHILNFHFGSKASCAE